MSPTSFSASSSARKPMSMARSANWLGLSHHPRNRSQYQGSTLLSVNTPHALAAWSARRSVPNNAVIHWIRTRRRAAPGSATRTLIKTTSSE